MPTYFLSFLADVSKDIPVLLSILRMSTKYDVSRLRERVLDILKAHYPRNPLRTPAIPVATSFPLLVSSSNASTSITAANVAREANTPILLPAILYACCSLPPEVLLGSWTSHKTSSNLPSLSPENLYAVLKARNDIILFTRRHIFGFAFSAKDLPDCRTPTECRRIRGELAESAEKHHPDGWIDPLSPGTFIAQLARVACVRCTEEAKRAFERGRKELWEGLPAMFGLPSWTELEKLSAMELGSD